MRLAKEATILEHYGELLRTREAAPFMPYQRSSGAYEACNAVSVWLRSTPFRRPCHEPPVPRDRHIGTRSVAENDSTHRAKPMTKLIF